MAKLHFPATAILALALAACTGDADDRNYETDVVDEGGGELIVTQPDPDAVEVDLPETPMTASPAEEATADVEEGGETSD